MAPNIFRPFKFGKETFHPQSFDENSFVMNFHMEKGAAVPPHKHVYASEHFRILRGEITFTVEGKKVIKTAGEEMMIPKLVPHSISAENQDVEVIVTFSPCADTHRLFQILATIEPSGAVTMTTMSKALYVMLQMNLKQFSNPHPAIANSIINAIVIATGKLWGWDKWTNKFRNTINTTNG